MFKKNTRSNENSPRAVDQFAIENPVHINKWLEQMTFEDRLDLCEGNRVQTQLLYGETVTVDSIEGDWAKVFCP